MRSKGKSVVSKEDSPSKSKIAFQKQKTVNLDNSDNLLKIPSGEPKQRNSNCEESCALNCNFCQKKFSLLRPIKKCEICFEYYCNEDAPKTFFRGEEKRVCQSCRDSLLYAIISNSNEITLNALKNECTFLESQESDIKVELQNQENMSSTLEHIVSIFCSLPKI